MGNMTTENLISFTEATASKNESWKTITGRI